MEGKCHWFDINCKRLINKRSVNLKIQQKKLKMNQKRKQRWYKWTERWENIESSNRCVVGVPEEKEKDLYEKTNIIINGKKNFFLLGGKKQKCPHSLLLFNIVLEDIDSASV